TPRTNLEGEITHFHGIIFDITERKSNEQTLIRERKALNIIAKEAVKTNEINLFCQSIITELASTLDFDIGTIRLFDPEDKSLHLVAEYNLKGAFGALPKALPIDSESAIISIVARNKEAIFSPTLAHPSLNKEILARMMSLGVTAHITYPFLNSENNLMGVIQLVSNKNIYLQESDKIFFESMHKLLATAIERMLTQNELIESESQFRTTVETMSDGITIIHKNKIMYANDRACEIFGYPHEEFMKLRTFIMIAPEDRERYLSDVQEMVTSCSKYKETEYWIVQKNGNRRYINNRQHVIYNEIGKPIDVFILTSDLTEKKIAEENLKKLNEELEMRVIKRTAQLALANEDLESFSYSVSHDLRTPLRSIDGFSQALQEDYKDQVDATGQDYLNRIRGATKRMGFLIDDILDLSRLTRKEITMEEINFSKLVNEIVKEFKRNDLDRAITINVQKNIKVRADSTLLRTVMENLIGNAWKFTSKKENATIEIGSAFLNNETTYYVKDNGVGFDKTYADKLFAVFQRLHSLSEFTGTGIGLAIVQRVISKHNGNIWAESELNQGATFYFTLPTETTESEEE
ncbi:MAG: ATP-binding protein, partial [Candidatus Heimdallarchaeota archaeon]